jgi:hypothetical protein
MTDKKSKKREKFYKKLVEELCENIEGLEYSESPFDDVRLVWRYNSGWICDYETYEELAKDIMKLLKIEKVS